MKHLCGTTATIERIEFDSFVFLTDFSSKGEIDSWEYVTDMLKPIEKEVE